MREYSFDAQIGSTSQNKVGTQWAAARANTGAFFQRMMGGGGVGNPNVNSFAVAVTLALSRRAQLAASSGPPRSMEKDGPLERATKHPPPTIPSELIAQAKAAKLRIEELKSARDREPERASEIAAALHAELERARRLLDQLRSIE